MSRIKYMVMDVDGTLTDGMIYMGPEGEIMQAFNAKDGYATVYLLPEAGITPVIITGRVAAPLMQRCQQIHITEVHRGVLDKTGKLREIVGSDDLSCVAYIGDDLNDLDCMREIKRWGGVIGCPSDACDEVLEIADFISRHGGGKGAMREFTEYIIREIE